MTETVTTKVQSKYEEFIAKVENLKKRLSELKIEFKKSGCQVL